MPEQHYEIVVSDQDLESTTVSWYEKGTVYIEQIEKGNKKKLIMLNDEELKQVHAVITAYLVNPEPHTSDCALHNSPAYPLEPCTCR